MPGMGAGPPGAATDGSGFFVHPPETTATNPSRAEAQSALREDENMRVTSDRKEDCHNDGAFFLYASERPTVRG
jgi:hypothetical protein